MLGTEHARFRRRLVGVVLENVPSAKNKIFRVRQRNEFLDQWRTPFGAFAQADRAHLRQRPYRARFVSADQFDTRHEGGDRKSTRLNSSHGYISYAVFC